MSSVGAATATCESPVRVRARVPRSGCRPFFAPSSAMAMERYRLGRYQASSPWN